MNTSRKRKRTLASNVVIIIIIHTYHLPTYLPTPLIATYIHTYTYLILGNTYSQLYCFHYTFMYRICMPFPTTQASCKRFRPQSLSHNSATHVSVCVCDNKLSFTNMHYFFFKLLITRQHTFVYWHYQTKKRININLLSHRHPTDSCVLGLCTYLVIIFSILPW